MAEDHTFSNYLAAISEQTSQDHGPSRVNTRNSGLSCVVWSCRCLSHRQSAHGPMGKLCVDLAAFDAAVVRITGPM